MRSARSVRERERERERYREREREREREKEGRRRRREEEEEEKFTLLDAPSPRGGSCRYISKFASWPGSQSALPTRKRKIKVHCQFELNRFPSTAAPGSKSHPACHSPKSKRRSTVLAEHHRSPNLDGKKNAGKSS